MSSIVRDVAGPIPPPRPPSPMGPWMQVERLDDPVALALAPWQTLDDPDVPLPSALRAALFDVPEDLAAPDDAPPPRLYALLDAARVVGIVERLEASGLPHRCLFTGSALEAFADTAPWLVELTPDSPLLRGLFTTTERADGLAEQEAGILIRSRATLEDLHRHLRRFTRLRDPEGNWFLFRYWSPPISTGLLAMGNVEHVDAFVAPLFPSGPAALSLICPSRTGVTILSRRVGTEGPNAVPRLTQPVVAHLRQLRREAAFEEVIEISLRHATLAPGWTDREMAAHLRTHRDSWFGMGFWQKDHLAKLCCWEAMLGPDFVERYDHGEIARPLRTSGEAWIAVERITRHLDGTPQPGIVARSEDL
ncbi:DUF4123 domain-containing protein [Jannaschia sp. Os4]|uniref:DUF4123 domain-containing protein n=1 Tax=Jannaschia sp. Os4 TaxID=2807617 RepID=UPI0019393CE1|nr:DUF4123 domain-containing protein [Jannaschia sp. Os4]MBM2575156.1 DUF4123 domain-containing protein [Jannaschia sp. Os4]